MLAGILIGVVVLFAVGLVAPRLAASLREARQWRALEANLDGQRLACFVRLDVDNARAARCWQQALEALREAWPVERLVETLDAVRVVVMPVESWEQAGTGRKVAGEATAATRTVAVGPSMVALAHELAHLVEAGPGRLAPPVEHQGWQEAGIYAAVEKYEAWVAGGAK